MPPHSTSPRPPPASDATLPNQPLALIYKAQAALISGAKMHRQSPADKWPLYCPPHCSAGWNPHAPDRFFHPRTHRGCSPFSLGYSGPGGLRWHHAHAHRTCCACRVHHSHPQRCPCAHWRGAGRRGCQGLCAHWRDQDAGSQRLCARGGLGHQRRQRGGRALRQRHERV